MEGVQGPARRRGRTALVGAGRARVSRHRSVGQRHRGMVPDSVTRAVKRISVRAGVELARTGHSLCIGHATTATENGADALVIADQGG